MIKFAAPEVLVAVSIPDALTGAILADFTSTKQSVETARVHIHPNKHMIYLCVSRVANTIVLSGDRSVYYITFAETY